VRSDHPDEVAASLMPGVTIVEHTLSPGQVVKLATPSDAAAAKPVFTVVLEKLLRERAAVRALLKRTTDPGQRTVLDCRQVSSSNLISM
jgi:DNA polymerase elongation subunit (family B)